MIDTAIYGLHKPEDTDSTDLRIFVGQNMDLIESALETKFSKNGGSITGSLTVTNKGDMVDLIKLDTDRSWTFKQKGTLSTAELILMSDNNSKTFRVTSPLGIDSLEIRVDNAVGSGFINSPLIKEDGISLAEKYALSTHSHAISEITDLTDTLNAKLESVPLATNTTVGLVKSGNGIGVNVEGYMYARLGKGLEFDVETNISAKVASAVQAGIVQVGNGLGMSGDYMFVKTGTGIVIDGAWSVGLDITYMDTNYVQIESAGGTGTVSKLWTGTQEQYDLLTTDPNTVYYIVG